MLAVKPLQRAVSSVSRRLHARSQCKNKGMTKVHTYADHCMRICALGMQGSCPNTLALGAYSSPRCIAEVYAPNTPRDTIAYPAAHLDFCLNALQHHALLAAWYCPGALEHLPACMQQCSDLSTSACRRSKRQTSGATSTRPARELTCLDGGVDQPTRGPSTGAEL